MVTATKHHLEITLKNLRDEAAQAGLMAPDEALVFDRGNRVNGNSPAVYVGRVGDLASFVPRFTPRNTQRECILMMEAITYALRTVRMNNLATK